MAHSPQAKEEYCAQLFFTGTSTAAQEKEPLYPYSLLHNQAQQEASQDTGHSCGPELHAQPFWVA